MATASLLNESPGCNPGLYAEFRETLSPGASFLSPGAIQMRIDQSQSRTKNVRPQITHDQMREECSFWIKRMFLPIEPHQRSVIALVNKVVDRTGLGPRRVEKLWRKYIAKPNAQEHATLGTAYQKWLADWKAMGFQVHDKNEAEHAEHTRAAVGYSASRWERVSESGQRNRETCATASAGADKD